jgi:hypothetical protein
LLYHCDEALMKTVSLFYAQSLRVIGESLELQNIGLLQINNAKNLYMEREEA